MTVPACCFCRQTEAESGEPVLHREALLRELGFLAVYAHASCVRQARKEQLES